ncbi:hypothetical protein C672_1396 [[Clostridium] bifermentans ATCC 638]|uniref:Nucleotidyltransferase domain protein n=1 Tax=Paraclostridium bifermentans ATCC 638 = DSM 14991 TaxID=1233171 RepID=T4VLS0_PARBF|nr:hypothetical protein [Paraclostridium bifermentans]EQK42453.1 hypothetical protein C672_1396 [[Clostridium] bifermentans ATCC 638] [Paraclostridium bifermentans ATCC 638 = DSM 14991]RIZ59968.1 hypothetical protein CHH45_03365 [Paraclostridium bifermentans]UAG19290.1 hypothetical protein KXZ80_06185 [Paraclostridium bifermentans]
MIKNFIKTYEQKIKNIKDDENTIAIFLVGSSKDIYNKKNIENITDIDLFIVSEQNEDQIRKQEQFNGIEFDINKFSKRYIEFMIDNKEYFFINEMRNAKVIYDKKNISDKLIYLSKEKYNEGPKKLSNEEILVMENTILENISRLEKKDDFENYEYEFLTNIYLKDIIKGHFIMSGKWMPKDKKIFKYLSENEKKLFELSKNVYKDYNYNNLKKVYEYVFKKIICEK